MRWHVAQEKKSIFHLSFLFTFHHVETEIVEYLMLRWIWNENTNEKISRVSISIQYFIVYKKGIGLVKRKANVVYATACQAEHRM